MALAGVIHQNGTKWNKASTVCQFYPILAVKKLLRAHIVYWLNLSKTGGNNSEASAGRRIREIKNL